MKGLSSKTHYELLGVSPEASKEEIKAAYREIARVYHPDSHFFGDIVGTAPLSSSEEDIFKAVTNAYNILSDEALRAQYDEMLPKGLNAWDQEDDESGGYHAATRSTQAFGTFGKIEPQKSALDEAMEAAAARPVSEVLRARRSFWGRIRAVLGL
jgi:DnaJ-class molecular chaperone